MGPTRLSDVENITLYVVITFGMVRFKKENPERACPAK